jgi:glucose/arabinose dehydrogenase
MDRGKIGKYKIVGKRGRTSAPEVVATGLTSLTSMAFDHHTRELFVTEINTGRIMRIEP